MKLEDGSIVLLKDGTHCQLMFRVRESWYVRTVEDGRRVTEPYRLDESEVVKVVKDPLTTKNARDQGEEIDPLRGTTAICCGAERVCIGCPREESAA